jgi:hypothetical protein
MGRRTYPGARLAENSLCIALAGILWGFEIRPMLVKGKEVPVYLTDNAFSDAGFNLPKPFAASFITRDDHRRKIIEEQRQNAQDEGYELRGVLVDVDGVVQHKYIVEQSIVLVTVHVWHLYKWYYV